MAESIRRRGFLVFDTDAYGKRLLDPGQEVYERLVERFGKRILAADGTISHAAVASIIFTDESQRQAVNQILHPVIFRGMRKELDASADPLVFAEVPLLYEAGWEGYFDRVLCVSCQEETAIRRLMAGRGYTREEARQRLAAQMDREEQIRRADLVIENDGSRQELEDRITELLGTLMEEAG